MNLRSIVAAALAAGALASGGPALSAEFTGDGFFGWLSVGKTTEIGPGHFLFTGGFAGTLLFEAEDNPLQHAGIHCPGSLSIGIKGAGYCIFTDRDGDKLWSEWSCTEQVEAPRGAISALGCTNTYIGGTGKYDGATGSNGFVGVIGVAHPDGTVSGYSLITDLRLVTK